MEQISEYSLTKRIESSNWSASIGKSKWTLEFSVTYGIVTTSTLPSNLATSALFGFFVMQQLIDNFCFKPFQNLQARVGVSERQI